MLAAVGGVALAAHYNVPADTLAGGCIATVTAAAFFLAHRRLFAR